MEVGIVNLEVLLSCDKYCMTNGIEGLLRKKSVEFVSNDRLRFRPPISE
jgi:hypothetical protein